MIESTAGHGRKVYDIYLYMTFLINFIFYCIILQCCLWRMNPTKKVKMEQEIKKWREKDLDGIKESLANPGNNYMNYHDF